MKINHRGCRGTLSKVPEENQISWILHAIRALELVFFKKLHQAKLYIFILVFYLFVIVVYRYYIVIIFPMHGKNRGIIP
jgi:hypothetical protein